MSERHRRDVAKAAKEKGPIEGGVRRVLTPITTSCHLKPTSGPAIKDAHGPTCYCGAPATVHVFYGPGCGNVCRKHAERVRRRYRAAQIEELDNREETT